MKIKVRTGDHFKDYEANSGKEAIKIFFKRVLSGQIKLNHLAPMGEWYNAQIHEWIPFRIAPALFKAGKLSADDLILTLRNCDLDFEPHEIMSMVQQDTWMVENDP